VNILCKFAEYIHEVLLDKIDQNKVSDLYFNDDALTPNGIYELKYERFSISNFAFRGKDFIDFPAGAGTMDFRDVGIPNNLPDEEIWLTEVHPKRLKKHSAVVGNALVSHFTFSQHQAPHIKNNTNLFDRYLALSQKKLSETYYSKLLSHN